MNIQPENVRVYLQNSYKLLTMLTAAVPIQRFLCLVNQFDQEIN